MKCPICGEKSLHLSDHECEPMIAREKDSGPLDGAPCSASSMGNTPIADALEKTRRTLDQQRTPAYGDALRKLREVEKANALLRKELMDAANSLYRVARTNADYIAVAHYKRCCDPLSNS